MKNVLMLGTGELVMSEILNKRGIDLNEGHRLPDLLNQCNPCVMCSSNPFHCKERKDCNAISKWVELVNYIEMLDASDTSKEECTIMQYGEIKELENEVKSLQAKRKHKL